MAIIVFSIAEALNILWKNVARPDSIKDITPAPDGLTMVLPLGIRIGVKRESFADGILKLKIEPGGWLSGLAGNRIDREIDKAIGPIDFIKRKDKSILVDLNGAINKSKVKGVSIKSFDISGNNVTIEF
ncbi:MAG: hypothetical protein NTW95_14460 [Candidatus Aminicenantes bacterium]|nr:hypothetical protein [Candidatus Aminicenantes bacterium]